jgi:hypothetical protein
MMMIVSRFPRRRRAKIMRLRSVTAVRCDDQQRVRGGALSEQERTRVLVKRQVPPLMLVKARLRVS